MTNLLDEVKRALEPFSTIAGEAFARNYSDDDTVAIKFRDLRRARSALAALEAAGGDEMVEAVAVAIEDADERYHIDFGLHDYTSYGRKPPHVMRDYRIREGSQVIFESENSDEAEAFYKRHRRHTIARAALAAIGVK